MFPGKTISAILAKTLEKPHSKRRKRWQANCPYNNYYYFMSEWIMKKKYDLSPNMIWMTSKILHNRTIWNASLVFNLLPAYVNSHSCWKQPYFLHMPRQGQSLAQRRTVLNDKCRAWNISLPTITHRNCISNCLSIYLPQHYFNSNRK